MEIRTPGGSVSALPTSSVLAPEKNMLKASGGGGETYEFS